MICSFTISVRVLRNKVYEISFSFSNTKFILVVVVVKSHFKI